MVTTGFSPTENYILTSEVDKMSFGIFVVRDNRQCDGIAQNSHGETHNGSPLGAALLDSIVGAYSHLFCSVDSLC